jgi:4-amino-4-deoxy-L-arabinose transferase-like glycosyltransferase
VTTAAERAPGHSNRRDWLVAGLAAVGLLALFVAVQRGRISTYDSKIAVATAKAIAQGYLHLDPADDFYGRHLPYSHHGIGMPLVILPLYVLQQAFHAPPEVLVTLASPLLLAGSGAVLYLSGRELGWSRRLSLAGALVFGTLTMALQISQDLFSEPGVAFAMALLVLGLLRWRAGRPSGPWLVGLGIGTGVLFRTDSVLLLGVGLLLLPAFVPWRRLLRQPWALAGLMLPIIAAVVWTGWYSMIRDGTPIPQVYGGSFRTPLLQGLHGLLISGGKSLFVFNPFLLLAIPGAVALWRRDRALTALALVLVAGRVLFFARWSAWYGGVAWGPRLLMPVVGPLSLLAVYALSRIPRLPVGLRIPAAVGVAALVVVSAVVSLASVWVWQGASWKWMTYRPPGLEGQALRQFSAERGTGYYDSLENNAIAYNLRHMGQQNPSFPLRNFRGGPTLVGLVSLTMASLAPLAAWLLAGRGQAGASTSGRPVTPRSASTTTHVGPPGRQTG